MINGPLDMGPWRAKMREVLGEIPDKEAWCAQDVARLAGYARLRPRDPSDKPDSAGRVLLAAVAREAMVARLYAGVGMEDQARAAITAFLIEESLDPQASRRATAACDLIANKLHFLDKDVRQAVLRVAHDADEWTAHVVRLNLGYMRDWAKRAAASGTPEVDPRWGDDPEIERLLK